MTSAEGPVADSVDAVASTLRHLIQTCRTAEAEFRAAASAVADPNLQRLFESYSQQRGEFAAELEAELSEVAPEGETTAPHLVADQADGTPEAPAEMQDEGTIFEQCERGENHVLQVYTESLGSALPADLRATVERQLLRIKEAHDQISSLHRIHSRHT
ncbi:MAG TPA: PA2169 family four-helix-bundle protein [Gemmatimonadales bacterium]